MEEELRRKNQLESLGILAGGLAHDFNNLLQGMLGNMDLAKIHLRPEDKSYNYLSYASDACLSAKNLSNQLLTFAEGGEPIKSRLRIDRFLKDWVAFYLSGSAVSSDFDIHPDCCAIEVDETQIRQVIQNVVINSVEAMPEGGRLHIGVRAAYLSGKDHISLNEGPYMQIAIRDEGMGIPENMLGRIFDPYVTTKTMGHRKGTGLGLTISYSIIKRHGGMISVESEEGKGTKVTIYLPYHIEEKQGQDTE